MRLQTRLSLTAVAVILGSLGHAAAQPQAPDPRFAAIVGGDGSPATVQHQLDMLGSYWWFSFAPSPYAIPGHKQVISLRTTADASGQPVPIERAQLLGLVASNPGTAWLIGNEPNVPGQDDITPEAYAQLLNQDAAIIKGADPSALIVGPNILNFSATCIDCPGINRGDDWLKAMVTAYQTAYGQSPPFDIWGIHTYLIDWDDLPMTDATVPIEQLHEFRGFVDSVQPGAPIWLTEFGVVWGCDELDWDAANRLDCPPGHLASDQIASFLATIAHLVVDEGPGLNLQAAFPYITSAPPESFAASATGIQLFDGAGSSSQLTPLGALWQRYAGGPLAPSPTPTTVPTSSPAAASFRHRTPDATDVGSRTSQDVHV